MCYDQKDGKYSEKKKMSEEHYHQAQLDSGIFLSLLEEPRKKGLPDA